MWLIICIFNKRHNIGIFPDGAWMPDAELERRMHWGQRSCISVSCADFQTFISSPVCLLPFPLSFTYVTLLEKEKSLWLHPWVISSWEKCFHTLHFTTPLIHSVDPWTHSQWPCNLQPTPLTSGLSQATDVLDSPSPAAVFLSCWLHSIQ